MKIVGTIGIIENGAKILNTIIVKSESNVGKDISGMIIGPNIHFQFKYLNVGDEYHIGIRNTVVVDNVELQLISDYDDMSVYKIDTSEWPVVSSRNRSLTPEGIESYSDNKDGNPLVNLIDKVNRSGDTITGHLLVRQGVTSESFVSALGLDDNAKGATLDVGELQSVLTSNSDYTINPTFFPEDLVTKDWVNLNFATIASLNSEIVNRKDADDALSARIEIFEGMFRLDADGNIQTVGNKGLYSNRFISAYGLDSSGGSGGGGIDAGELENILTSTSLYRIHPSFMPESYVNQSFLSTNYYNKTEIDSKISAALKFKGSVASYEDLPLNPSIGDMWNVETAYEGHPAGTNYAWDGEKWDALGGAVDMSLYLKKVEAEGIYATIVSLNTESATRESADTAISNRIKIFESMFEFDSSGNIKIKDNKGLYSTSFLSAYGLDSNSGGGGGGSNVYWDVSPINNYKRLYVNDVYNDLASVGHIHTKAEVGLGNVDNTADANKSVSYAVSSGSSANSNALRDKTNGTLSYLDYGRTRSAYSSKTWLAAWDGYNVVAVAKPSTDEIGIYNRYIQVNGVSYNFSTLAHSVANSTVDLDNVYLGRNNTAANSAKLQNLSLVSPNNYYSAIPYIQTDGVMEVGRYLDFHSAINDNRDFATRVNCMNVEGAGNAVNLPTDNGTLALLTDNVASATSSTFSNYVTFLDTVGMAVAQAKDALKAVLVANSDKPNFHIDVRSGNLLAEYWADDSYVITASSTTNTYRITTNTGSYARIEVLLYSGATIFTAVLSANEWQTMYELATTLSNVASATKLQTPRNIGNTPFDGTKDITLVEIGAVDFEEMGEEITRAILEHDTSDESHSDIRAKLSTVTELSSNGLLWIGLVEQQSSAVTDSALNAILQNWVSEINEARANLVITDLDGSMWRTKSILGLNPVTADWEWTSRVSESANTAATATNAILFENQTAEYFHTQSTGKILGANGVGGWWRIGEFIGTVGAADIFITNWYGNYPAKITSFRVKAKYGEIFRNTGSVESIITYVGLPGEDSGIKYLEIYAPNWYNNKYYIKATNCQDFRLYSEAEIVEGSGLGTTYPIVNEYLEYTAKNAHNATQAASTPKLSINNDNTNREGGLKMLQRFNDADNPSLGAWYSTLRLQHGGYDAGYWQELAMDFSTDRPWVRRNNNGQYSDWRGLAMDDEKAPTNHVSYDSRYGVGNTTYYGHLKLSDTVNSTETSSSGRATTPKAVYDAIVDIEVGGENLYLNSYPTERAYTIPADNYSSILGDAADISDYGLKPGDWVTASAVINIPGHRTRITASVFVDGASQYFSGSLVNPGEVSTVTFQLPANSTSLWIYAGAETSGTAKTGTIKHQMLQKGNKGTNWVQNYRDVKSVQSWTIEEVEGNLQFKYGGVTKQVLLSNGDIQAYF